MKKAALFFAYALSALTVLAQPTEKSLMGKAKSSMKITTALQEMDVYNYRGAVVILTSVLDEFRGDVEASFLMAQCLYELKSYEQARAYLDSVIEYAKTPTPGQLMVAGKVYQSVAQLDKALAYYQQYKATPTIESDDLAEVAHFIRQCEYAKKQMASPKSVKLETLGAAVNSRYDDYTPVLSNDGGTMYFTSRRPIVAEENKIDRKGDYKYFEDIYETKFENGKWLEAKLLAGNLNTEKYDAVLSLSPDGEEMYVYVNDGKSGGDISFSKKGDDNSWSAAMPVEFPINSANYEGAMAVSPSGNTVYFISERSGGYGQGDIWRIQKDHGGEWGAPENLGPAINTPYDEKFILVHPNGKTLFFASNGHLGVGSYDIYRTTIVNGSYTPPVNLGYPINTTLEESTFSFSANQKTMYLAAIRPEGDGDRDIYQVDVSAADVFEAKEASEVVAKLTGMVVTEGANKIAGATVTVYDAISNQLVATTQADEQGSYTFVLPKVGDYQLRIQQPGFLSGNEKISIKTGAETTLVKNLVLKNEVELGKKVSPKKEAKVKKEKKEEDEEEPEEKEEAEEDDE